MMWLCCIQRRDFPGGADGKKKGQKRKRRAGGEGVVPEVRHVCFSWNGGPDFHPDREGQLLAVTV